jgi:hypothetical protein
MDKIINLNDTVYEICKKNNEVIEIMRDLGFDGITNPALLNSAGRVMTISKGAKMKKIDLDLIIKEFENRGYTVIK